MSTLLLLGLVFVLIGVEALADRLLVGKFYEARDSELSLGLAAGWAVSGIVGAALSSVAIGFAYSHRVLNLGATPAWPLTVIVLADLIYYVWHRLSHRWSWLWASHFPHHTAKRLNVLASLRQGWTDVLSGTWLSWAVLGFLGFSPIQTAPYFVLLLAWEACVHNEWVPKLGPLEWLFVTPSHHRVHHSLQAAHVDRNFGGVLILWDRLFGTFRDEGPAIVHAFGLAGFDPDTSNPIAIATHEWRGMLASLRAAHRA